DSSTAERIHALAEAIKAERNFSGTLIRSEHLHVTLFHLGDWIELPSEIVTRASEAASRVAAPAFEVEFHRAESLRNRTGIYPFVLTGDNGATPLRAFHTLLGEALNAAGLGGATRGDFKPHVTLLRDAKRASPSKVAPIVWTVREFVL